MLKTALWLFVLGLSFGAGPCLASCGPLLTAYIIGSKKGVVNSLGTYLLFSAGRISVYLVLGVAVFLLGNGFFQHLTQEYSKYIFIVGGIFLIALGILMVYGKGRNFGLCDLLHRRLVQENCQSALALGIITGLLPCAPLVALFTYVGLVSKSWPQSIIYSFSFGAGTFISPLLLLAVLAGLMPRFFSRREYLTRILEVLGGLVMVVLGIFLIQGGF